MKSNYPDIDSIDNELPDWQKQILDDRLKDIEKNQASLRPISDLLVLFDKEI